MSDAGHRDGGRRTFAATAQAQPNIALIKYWGKRDVEHNVPATTSLSVTLDSLTSVTEVCFDAALAHDEFELDGEPRPELAGRVTACLDRLRQLARIDRRARVTSSNNFPTGAGLASSASGFAALAVAAGAALGLELPLGQLAVHARRASASAARSLLGGFVELPRGERSDGADAVPHQVLGRADWPLEIVIAVTSEANKPVGSTDGMRRSATTSPYYAAWVDSSQADLEQARRAIDARDFAALAEVSEASCLKMHALALSARPGLIYWNAATVECLHRLRELRAVGQPVFFTIDAGPQVKAFCAPGTAGPVATALAELPGVQRVLRSGIGDGARLVVADAAA